MLLKRIYRHDGPEPVLDRVEVLRAKDKQNFSTRFVEKGIQSGLVTLSSDTLTLNTEPVMTYRIVNGPGYYCCHCEEPLTDPLMAFVHLRDEHEGAASPDAQNPAGYRRDNFFACERVS